VIWETVRKIAERVGVKATPHALRAAFAVQFDEANPDQLVALKELMGHARMETTLVYLRRKDKARAMEVVRDLSWGGAGHFVFPSSEEAAYKKPPLSRGFGEEAHTGFRHTCSAALFRRRVCTEGCTARSREHLGVVELVLVGEHVRVDAARRRDVVVTDRFADPGPRHPAEVQEADPAVP
jgi:hypothetical protein